LDPRQSQSSDAFNQYFSKNTLFYRQWKKLRNFDEIVRLGRKIAFFKIEDFRLKEKVKKWTVMMDNLWHEEYRNDKIDIKTIRELAN